MLFTGINWYSDPSGNYESIIAIGGILLGLIEYYKRTYPKTTTKDVKKHSQISSDTPASVNSISVSTSHVTNGEPPLFKYSNCASFFSERFAAAFPGLRESKYFYGKEAVNKLALLLGDPIKFSNQKNGIKYPIWWFRSENNMIQNFKLLENNKVLINHMELDVNRLYAAYNPSYKKLFVYVEFNPELQTGLYNIPPDTIRSDINDRGYSHEEYGLYNGVHEITRNEYDDNATEIMGKIVKLDDNCEIRARYLSTFNFVICAHDCVINNSNYDSRLKELLNKLAVKEDCMNLLIEEVDKLPINR